MLRALLRDSRTRIALVVLLLVSLGAVLAPVLAPYDPTAQLDIERLQSLLPGLIPSWGVAAGRHVIITGADQRVLARVPVETVLGDTAGVLEAMQETGMPPLVAALLAKEAVFWQRLLAKPLQFIRGRGRR